jgi:hypothetical protein
MFKNLFSAKKDTTPELIDTELGLPYGDPGTPERAAWIKADNANTRRILGETGPTELQRRLAGERFDD